MARVPYLDQADLSPQNRDLLARNINLYRALAHSPEAARNFMNVGRYIRYHSQLDPRLREMAILQVGYVTRSPYEYSHHIKIGRDFGVTDNDIRAIEAETRGEKTDLPDLARAILRAARELAFGGVTVNEAPTFRADQMPYGGVKDSGNTREGPAYAAREMTEERVVVLQL